nr:RPM1-interacting protein 4 [Ipomoea batatas]GMC85699.1 RPM1-interacting protein 4 [Ipomoea batatas]
MQEMGRPLPKFGEWDVNDPASAEGFTVIFNKARNEKRAGGKKESPPKRDPGYKHKATLGKPQSQSKINGGVIGEMPGVNAIDDAKETRTASNLLLTL